MKKLHPYWTNYGASENGSVFGSRGGILKPIDHHTGYQVMTVRKHGIQKQLRVHRFVWECFKGEIPEDLVINHIDGDKHNNRLENLEIVTTQENIVHAWVKLGRVSVKGEDKPTAKLTEDQVLIIINMCKEGVSNKVIADKFDIHPNYVSLIRHNKRWRHLPR